MNNQIIVWALIVLPWFSLFFMKKEEIKRFMPVALVAMVTTSIVIESGITLKLWSIRETTYPLNHTLSYVYGLAPVVALWIFKYTYQKFWLYMAVDSIFNLGFAFLFTPWLVSRGIKDLFTSKFNVFLIVTALSLILYLYQMWQETARVDKRVSSTVMQPNPALKLHAREDEEKE